MLLHICDRILPGVCHPEAVHLKIDKFRIERFQKVIVRGRIAVFLELEIVIVIAVLNAELLGLLPGFVEEFSQALEVIKGLSLLRLEDGVDHVFQSYDLGILDGLFPVRFQVLGHVVPAGSRQPVILQDLGKFRGRLPVEVVNLHFLVANRCDLLDRPQHVMLKLIAQRVKLQPDWLAQGIGKKLTRHPRGGCDGGCAESSIS